VSREQGAAKPARKRDVEEERFTLKRRREKREVEEERFVMKAEVDVEEERFTLEWKVDVEEEVEEDVEGDAEDCCWGRTRLKTLEGLKRERYYL